MGTPLSVKTVELVSSLFLQHRRKVFSFFYLNLRDRDMSEDMVSEVFLKVAMAIEKGIYTDEGKPGAWILRISHNFLIDHYRRVKKEGAIRSSSESDSLVSAAPEPSLRKDEMLLNMEISEEVRGLLDLLPFEQKEVAMMRMTGTPFKEIAIIQQVSINTALGRMRYALINLRRMIKERNMDLHGYKMSD